MLKRPLRYQCSVHIKTCSALANQFHVVFKFRSARQTSFLVPVNDFFLRRVASRRPFDKDVKCTKDAQSTFSNYLF